MEDVPFLPITPEEIGESVPNRFNILIAKPILKPVEIDSTPEPDDVGKGAGNPGIVL